MIHPEHFRRLVIRPTLGVIGMHSLAAERLLLTTAIAESGLRYLEQLGGGPALGVYQVEPTTLADVWGRYLCEKRPDLRDRVAGLMTGEPVERRLVTNLAFATAIARVKFWMSPAPMPAAEDAEAMGRFYKAIYNTAMGAANADTFAEQYRLYGLAA